MHTIRPALYRTGLFLVIFTASLLAYRQVFPASAGPAVEPAPAAAVPAVQTLLDMSGDNPSSDPSYLGSLEDIAFFSAYDTHTGYHVWRTDGTITGTYPILPQTIQPAKSATAATAPSAGFPMQQTFYLNFDGLYTSDGTPAGTTRVTETATGETLYDGSHFIQARDDLLYLMARTWFSVGDALWAIHTAPDGSPLLVEKVFEGDFTGMAATMDGRLFLHQEIRDNFGYLSGMELWVSDGTTAGTQLLHLLPPAFMTDMLADGGRMFFTIGLPISNPLFSSYHEILWVSDGTITGTQEIYDSSYPENTTSIVMLAPLGGQLLFSASDDGGRRRLWRSDGTPAGTELLQNIDVSSQAGVLLGGRVFFTADDGVHGFEPWVSDGSPTGTLMIRDINPAPYQGGTGRLGVGMNGRYYFRSDDGVHGSELWSSDGSEAGTFMLLDGDPGTTLVDRLVLVGSEVYFARMDGWSISSLWKSDGTSANTVLVHHFTDDTRIGYFNDKNFDAFGDRLFLILYSEGFGLEPWVAGGGQPGAWLLKDINFYRIPDYYYVRTPLFTGVNGKLFFEYDDGTNGFEPWVSSGDITSTHLLADTYPGPEDIWDETTTVASSGPWVYFLKGGFHNQGHYHTELWSTDLTPQGTQNILTMRDDPAHDLSNLTQSGGRVFLAQGSRLLETGPTPDSLVLVQEFANPIHDISAYRTGLAVLTVGHPEQGGLHFWTTDGTANAAELVANLNLGYETTQFFDPLNDVITFFHGWGLWRSDGNPAATYLLQDKIGWAWSNGREIYMSRYDEASGYELWISDGTPGGTRLVRDIRPGPESSDISGGMFYGSKFYFTADDGEHKPQLWLSDGTPGGTQMLADVIPATPGFEYIGETAFLDGQLYFTARDTATGSELWVMDSGDPTTARLLLDGIPGPLSSFPEHLTGSGGRLYFVSYDEQGYYALRVYDPTEEHTFLPSVAQWGDNPLTP